MAKVEVYNWKKETVGNVELPDDIYGKELRKDLLQTVVKWQLACRRRGTQKAKTRAEVRGGGKKPFRQKGTGNARQGSSRSPLMESGGIVFAPRPRDYSYNLPKSLKKAAIKNALSYLVKENKFFVVEDMKSEGKTNELAKRLKNFGIEKTVLIDKEQNDMFTRATRNLPKVRYYTAEGLNVYDLLKYDAAVVTKDALDSIATRLGEKA
tara:strand:- start:3059 stop:3685 length:627 start_codon:yes stop_codon:yes gene_type:complete